MTDFTDVTATSFAGPLAGDVTGNLTGNATGGQVLPTPTAYSGADAATKAISPALFWATLTKASAGTDRTSGFRPWGPSR